MVSVLMVADSLDVGGAERHVVALASGLAERGHDVRLACSAAGPLLADAADAGLPVAIMAQDVVKRRVSAEFAAFVAGEIERRPVDIVHAHLFAAAAAAATACEGRSCRLVITEHSEAVWRGAADLDVCRWVRSRSHAVIAVSQEIARRLVEEEGTPPELVSVIPNAVMTAPCPPRRPRSHPVVGAVARLRPEKGVDVLLRAAAIVSSRRPDVRFVVVGDGPEAPALRRQTSSMGLQHRITFLGPRTDGPQLVAGFDVLAVPSLANEGTPLVVLEALASGVPVVASRTGGIPQQLRDGLDGTLVEPGDPRALAEALCAVLDQGPLAARRAPRIAREVRSRFPLAAMLDAVEAVYRGVLAGAHGVPDDDLGAAAGAAS